MKKVLVPSLFRDLLINKLKEHNLQPIVTKDQQPSTILQKAKDVSGIISLAPVGKPLMKKLPNLKIIARPGVGYDDIDIKGASQLGIYVTNAPGANAKAVAENTVADILILSKHLYSTSNRMRGGNGVSNYHRHELAGKTVGIVGFGHIARQVIKMLSDFDVNILIWNRHKRESKYGKFVDWNTLIKNSDYLSLHIPATPQTKHIINADVFKAMKTTAFIINFGRGDLINQTDLVNALKNKEIKGAGLDVFEKEPLPQSSALRKLPNVFLTPHCGGGTVESFHKMTSMAVNNVINVLNGKAPLNPVNKIK